MIHLYLLILILSLPVIPVFSLEEDVIDNKIIDNKVLDEKIDDIQGRLVDHSGKSIIQFIQSFNIAIVALIISLAFAGFSAWKADQNTKETHRFITKTRFLQDANNFYNLGDYVQAKTSFEKALELSPNDWKVLLMIGNCYAKLRDNPKAISFYEKTLENEPKSHIALNNKGIALNEIGQPDQALICHQESLLANPSFADGLNNIGVLYQSKNEHQKAIEYFHKVFEIIPNESGTLANLAKSYEKLKDYNKAILFADKSINYSKNNLKTKNEYIQSLITKGICYFQLKIS